MENQTITKNNKMVPANEFFESLSVAHIMDNEADIQKGQNIILGNASAYPTFEERFKVYLIKIFPYTAQDELWKEVLQEVWLTFLNQKSFEISKEVGILYNGKPLSFKKFMFFSIMCAKQILRWRTISKKQSFNNSFESVNHSNSDGESFDLLDTYVHVESGERTAKKETQIKNLKRALRNVLQTEINVSEPEFKAATKLKEKFRKAFIVVMAQNMKLKSEEAIELFPEMGSLSNYNVFKTEGLKTFREFRKLVNSIH